MKAARRLGSSLQLGRVPTGAGAVHAQHACPGHVHPAADQQAHFVSRLIPAAIPSTHISSQRNSRSSSCSSCSSSRRLLPAAQHSSEGLLQHRHSIRCYSTPNLTPPSEPIQHISWLQDIQVWCPEALGTSSSSSNSSSSSGCSPVSICSSSDSSNNSSSSSSSSSSSTNGSSSNTAVYHPLRFQQLSEAQLRDPSSTFDAIIVLAGGLTADGGLPEWVHRRMDVARDLHLLQGRRPPIVCSGGGTPHKPSILGPTGHVIHESTSGATYLMATGLQPGAIFKEVSSYDTVGNAYYALCIHVIPAGWRRLAVVTSDFHMPRSRALFCDIYRLAGQSLFGDPNWFSLTFLSASDEGVFDTHVYNARLGKEAGSLAMWQKAAVCLPDFPAFREWIHTDHLCYAVPRQHEFGKRTIQDQRLLDSY